MCNEVYYVFLFYFCICVQLHRHVVPVLFYTFYTWRSSQKVTVSPVWMIVLNFVHSCILRVKSVLNVLAGDEFFHN